MRPRGHTEVEESIDAELGPARALVPMAIGSRRYENLRRTVVTAAQGRAGSVRRPSDMLRPVFKDDEWLVAGFAVGELPVLILENLGGL